MLGGYAGKLLRVNLSTGAIKKEKLDEETAYNFLGGRGYAANILYKELKQGTDALGPKNKLVFMTGPLTGTGFPGAGRTSISAKSPLTGTIFDSSMGGSFGTYLKRAELDGIIVEGKAKKPVYLLIDGGRVSLKDASNLWGKTTSEAGRQLRKLYKNSGVAVIGPAGEQLVKIACIVSEVGAARGGVAGRGGIGTVMGSKNLKAIVVRGDGKVNITHKKTFEKILEKVRRTIDTHPITGRDGGLARFGTALLVHRVAAAGMLPKNNFSGAHLDFKDVDDFSGETIREKYLVRKTACFACPTGCGRRIKVKGKEGKGAEFESIAMLGPNAGFYDYEREILPLAQLCDELGLDTISTGNILGFARAVGKINGLDDAKKLIEEISDNKSVFSMGLAKAAKKLGGGTAAHIKGLELPAYDPRGAKGIALAYATSNRGGCHLRAYTIAPEILSNPEYVNPSTEIGKAKLVRRMQDAFTVYDSLVACKFHGFALFSSLEYELDDVAKILTAVTGLKWTNEHLREIGSRIYSIERLFNTREGFTQKDDELPKKFGIDLKDLLQNYYKERGWSKEGIPTAHQKLRKPERAAKVGVVANPFERVKFPQLQIALDMDADVETIAEIAKQAYAGGARIIEAGTPAIKRHGTDSLLPALRKVAPHALIVADLKTMDVGNLEARIAFRAGADVAAVLAIGGRTKIIEALSEAIGRDKAILIDLIDCEDPLATIDDLAKELKGNENRVAICLHRGISEQLKGRGIYEQKQLISEAKKRAASFPLFVAGGIKEGVAKDVAGAGADVCIAGSAIYNSSNPKETVQRILAEIRKSYKR
jgi:aldehyde:ferredoxin oxidoreductase